MIFGQAVKLPTGYISKCFNPSFEARYNNYNAHAGLNFGATIFVDGRHTGVVTASKVQVNIEKKKNRRRFFFVIFFEILTFMPQ